MTQVKAKNSCMARADIFFAAEIRAWSHTHTLIMEIVMQKDILKQLVEEGRSIREIGEFLGKSYTTVRYWLDKYALKTKPAQFGRRSWTDEDLVRAVRASDSMGQVASKLGLSCTAAGNRGTIQKYIKSLGIDTSHFTGKGWSSKRPGFSRAKPLEEILVVESTYSTSNLKARLLAAGLKEKKCECCGLTTWRGEDIPLEVHHINGIANDHRLENLQLICPNCHAQTDNYRGKNRRKGSSN